MKIIFILLSFIFFVYADNPNKETLNLGNNQADVYYKEGLQYTKEKKYTLALKMLHKASKLNPKKNHCYYNDIGNIFYEQQKYEKAEVWYKKAIELTTKNYRAYYNLALIYYVREDFNKAIEWNKEAIKLNSKSKESHFLLGNSYFSLKKYELAIKSYEIVIELDPNHTDAIGNLALCYVCKQEYLKAETIYKKAISINDKNSIDYLVLFDIQLIQDKTFDKDIEKKFFKIFQNKKNVMIIYDAYKILQKISNKQNIDKDMKNWIETYKTVKKVWIFEDVQEWISKKNNKEIVSKLENALDIFRRQIEF